jgi:uncharacterized glyoxalase superfamily protein PhnB
MSLHLKGPTPLLQVFDMPASLRFYCQVLEFEVVSDSGVRDTPEGRFAHWVWLRKGECDLMLNTAYDEGERPSHKDGARWGGHEDVCLYFGCADVDEAYDVLRAKLPTIAPPADTPYGMRQLTLSDPDGFQLCLQAPI